MKTILLTSRVGNFKLVPVSSTDAIVERDIKLSLEEVKAHMDGWIKLANARDLKF